MESLPDFSAAPAAESIAAVNRDALCSSLRYNTFQSPHYTDSHRAFRAKVRAFVDNEVIPFVHEVGANTTEHSAR